MRRRAKKSAHKATAAIFRLGRWLSQAHAHLLDAGRGEWTAFLAENEIPRTTAWEAEELFRRAKTEEAVNRMTPTEAKRHFGVVKEREATPTPTPPLHLVKPGMTAADSSEDDGVSMVTPVRRPGDPPIDPDSNSGRATAPAAGSNPTEQGLPQADHESGAVEGDACAPAGAAERDAGSAAPAADEPPLSGEQHPLLTTIVQIVRRLEQVAEDLPTLDLTTEPTDAIGREIDQGIVMFNKLKGGLAR